MTAVRERFNPIPMAANAAYAITGPYMAAFIAVTAGTITVTSVDASGVTAVTLVAAFPVAVGSYNRFPIIFPATGGTVTLAGGASGTLLV